MSFRFTLILLAVAVIVVGGIAAAQKNSPAPAPSVTPTPVVINLQPQDVTEFNIQANGHETDLLKSNGAWQLVKPEKDPNVDQGRISSLVGQVANLSGSRTVAKASDNLKPFGLDNPKVQVSLTTGNNTTTLLIGNPSIDGNSYYAMRKGGSEVALIDSTVPNGLIQMADTPPKATPTPTPAPTTAATPAATTSAASPTPTP